MASMTHEYAEFDRPLSGLRSTRLASHMTMRHGEITREQLDTNGYELTKVSHDWLADVHYLAHHDYAPAQVRMTGGS